ncbi:MAG: hypothetical protein LUE61_08175, partial [Clostridiales bacterium]|nr:hypothetical protein [Clostridiales bacterium]
KVSLDEVRYKGFVRPSLAKEAGPTFLAPPRKVAKEGGLRVGPVAPLLRISPYPTGGSALFLNQVVYQATDEVTFRR